MASSNTVASTAPEFWCKICKLPFKTDGAFKIHKVNSDRHICCDVCGADFKSEEGRKRHRAAHHAEEQDLTCKFCGLNYPRVGSLINHYEESQCRQVSKDVFKQAIKDIMVRETAKRKAHNFVDFRRSGDFSGQEPLPPLRTSSQHKSVFINNGGLVDDMYTENTAHGSSPSQFGGSSIPFQAGKSRIASGARMSPGQGPWSNAPNDAGWNDSAGFEMEPPLINVVPDVHIRDDEDLISFDVSDVLNSPWTISASDALRNAQRFNKAKDFPALGGETVDQQSGQGATPSIPSQAWSNEATNAARSGREGRQGICAENSDHGPSHIREIAGHVAVNPMKQGPVYPNDKFPCQDNTQRATSSEQGQKLASRGPPYTWGKPNISANSVTEANYSSTTVDQRHTYDATRALHIKNNGSKNDTAGFEKSVNGIVRVPSTAVPNPQAGGPVQNPWGKKNLFPNAPPPVAPPVDLLSSLNINTGPPTKVYRMFDPADPEFRASKFYLPIIGRWKCPHKGCNGSYKSQNAFVAHLSSASHSDEKYQCLKCLRIYDSLTALTQHSESQGVRCNVRETDDFDSVVRAITADTTTTNGRMADDTIRYEINPNADLSKAKMTANYRAAEREKAEAKKHYWDNRDVKW